MAKKEKKLDGIEYALQQENASYPPPPPQGIPTVKLIDIDEIVPTPDNPRDLNTEDQSFVDLMESILLNGVNVPVAVRKNPDEVSNIPYMLIYGERRWTALKKLNAKKRDTKTSFIPALDHGKLDDAVAYEMTLRENANRNDLTPIEQGRAVRYYLEKHNTKDVREIAEKLGMSATKARAAARIETHLSNKWKERLAENPNGMSLSALALVARMPNTNENPVQDEMIRHLWQEWKHDGPTMAEVERASSAYLRRLADAKFPTGDETLIDGCISCFTCSALSSKNPGLFDDETDQKKINANERCLNGECFKRKTIAWLEWRFDELKKEHPTLIAISIDKYDGAYSWTDLKIDISGATGEDGEEADFCETDKNDPGAIPALILDGERQGDFTWVEAVQAAPTMEDEENAESEEEDPEEAFSRNVETEFSEKMSAAFEALTDADIKALFDEKNKKNLSTLFLMFGFNERLPWNASAEKYFELRNVAQPEIILAVVKNIIAKITTRLRAGTFHREVQYDLCRIFGIDDSAILNAAFEKFKPSSKEEKPKAEKKARKK